MVMKFRCYSTKVTSIEEALKKNIANEQRKFAYENQRAIGLANMPYTPLKSAIENAKSEPWRGEESLVNTSKRMLEDAIKPMKITRQKRVRDARENALDYKLDNQYNESRKDHLTTSRAIRSMQTGGRSISAGMSSGGWIESMAGMEIENAAKMGKFDSIKRGEGTANIHQEFLESNRNPSLDLTEYLLNNIIKKQGGAPPWIMKQQAVRKRIDFFRSQMKQRLQERLVPKLLQQSGNNVENALRIAQESKLKDTHWENHYFSYHEEFITSLNSQIRGYNLQAPQTARWGYLNIEDEVNLCYENVKDGLENQLRKFTGTLKIEKLDKNSLHSHLPPVEDPSKHYGLKQLFKDLFGYNKNQ